MVARDFEGFIRSIPVITRIYMGCVIVLSVALKLGITTPMSHIFLWPLIKRGEIWRLITPFFFYGELSVQTLFVLFMLFQYSRSLEQSIGDTAEYLYFFIFTMVVTIGIAPALKIIILSRALEFGIIYLSSRRNPNRNVMLLFFPLQAKYLPIAFLLLHWLMGDSLKELIVAFLVSHLYFYLHDVLPATSGVDPLRTPKILEKVINRVENPQPEQQDAAQANNPWMGQGNRVN
ncbi:hypothetical protein PCE1_004000 [Barthelona sp. PCE]